MSPYADTNFFSRFYLRLSESEEVSRVIEKARSEEISPLPVTWLHRIETLNAFQLYVFAGQVGGQVHVTREQAAAAQASFRADLVDRDFIRPAQVDLQELEDRVEELALRHTAKHGFRAYDLIHVASALLLNCDVFWSFDPKASRLAQLEGLRVR